MTTEPGNSVVYFFTADEIRKIQALEFKRRFRWFHKAAPFAVAFGVPVIAFAASYAFFGEKRLDAAIAALLSASVSPLIFLSLQYAARPVLNPVKTESDPAKISYYRCTLRNDGILSESNFRAALWYWHGVEDIQTEDGIIRIKFAGDALGSLNIPVRIFASLSDADAFFDLARALWKEDVARRANDALATSQAAEPAAQIPDFDLPEKRTLH